jgi:precorrin-3B synthase
VCHDVAMPPKTAAERTDVDRCPGVFRPWIADDGALVRLRVVGGVVPAVSLATLVDVAREFGDGNVYVTSRANLQVRHLAHVAGRLPEAFVSRITDAGLLPSRTHELVRNIMVSPLTGRVGGRADLMPMALELDRLLCASRRLAQLPGRFLFVLDDGRGDVSSRTLDLGAVAVGPATAQLRVGSSHWGRTLSLAEAPAAILELARRFLDGRGAGDTAAWHVDELPLGGAELLDGQLPRDERTLATTTPPSYGSISQDDGRLATHVEVLDGVLTPSIADAVLSLAVREVIVTPWRSIVVPDQELA